MSRAPKYNYPLSNEGDALNEYQCVAFLVPDGWWNRANLIGAFRHMTHDYAWVDTSYGKLVAEAWRNGFIMSEEDRHMALTEVINNINVQCSGCSGCSGGSTNTETSTNIQEAIDATLPVDPVAGVGLPPIDDPLEIPDYMQYENVLTIAAYDEERCRRANWVADKIESSIGILNDILVGMQGDFIEGLGTRIATGIALAMADTPAPGFADVAGLLLILGPKVAGWLSSATIGADITTMSGLSFDKPAIVTRVYNSNTSNSLGDLHAEFIVPILSASGASDEMIEIWERYNSFVWGSRFGNWYFSNGEALFTRVVPRDHPITYPCVENASGSWIELFTEGMNGWEGIQMVNSTMVWEEFPATNPVEVAGDQNGPRVRPNPDTGGDYHASLTKEWTVGQNVCQSNTQIWVYAAFYNFHAGGKRAQIIVTFDDASSYIQTHQSPPHGKSYLWCNIAPEHDGKSITRIQFNVDNDGFNPYDYPATGIPHIPIWMIGKKTY